MTLPMDQCIQKWQLIEGPLSHYWVILSMANNTIEIYIRNIIARCSRFVWILKCSWSLAAFKRDQTLYKALLLWYKRSYRIVLIFEWFCRPRRLLLNATWKYHFCNIILDYYFWRLSTRIEGGGGYHKASEYRNIEADICLRIVL